MELAKETGPAGPDDGMTMCEVRINGKWHPINELEYMPIDLVNGTGEPIYKGVMMKSGDNAAIAIEYLRDNDTFISSLVR